MIAEAGAAISGVKVAMDMAKGIAALKSEAEINQAVIDIQRTLLDVQSAAIEDKQRIVDLNAKIHELQSTLSQRDNWADEAKRYVLTEAEVGTFTYELRSEFANGETYHRLCVTCFENGKKAILHGRRFGMCNSCNKQIKIQRDPPINIPSTRFV